jgi:GNAT superfamily N-acetyltransferase
VRFARERFDFEDAAALARAGVCRFDDNPAELKHMHLVPEARGQGLGRVLGHMEEEARRLGYTAPCSRPGSNAASSPRAARRAPRPRLQSYRRVCKSDAKG